MIFRVEVPLYRIGIIFMFGHDREKAEKWLEDNGLLGEGYVDTEMLDWCFTDPHHGITCHNNNGNRICVHVDSIDNHGSIAHEIYHATMKLMEYVGMRPNEANEEAFAYVVGYVTEEVYNKIKEHEKGTA